MRLTNGLTDEFSYQDHALLLQSCDNRLTQQETHYEMRIPERDVTFYLFTYLRLSIDIH